MSNKEEYLELPTKCDVCEQIGQFACDLPTTAFFSLDGDDERRMGFNRILRLCGDYIDGGGKCSVPFEMSHELYCAFFNLARFRLSLLRVSIIETVDAYIVGISEREVDEFRICDEIYNKIFDEWPQVFGRGKPNRVERYARKTLNTCLSRLCRFWLWMENEHYINDNNNDQERGQS